MKAAMRELRHRLGRLWLARYARLAFTYWIHIRPNLKRQLGPLPAKPAAKSRRPKILVPLIETTHYQFYQVLALAKALELRGAHIKLLLCGSRLNGCEPKSIRTSKTDPCLACRFNHEKVVPFFGLETAVLSDYVSEEQVKAIRARAVEVAREYPVRFEFKGVDIIPMTTDSSVRYFYGATPADGSTELRDVRARHLETSMIGLEAAEAIASEWEPDSLLGNMNVYTAWEPYLRFFGKRSIKMNIVSISTFNHTAVVFNRMDLYGDGRRYERWLETRGGGGLNETERRELADFMKGRFEGSAPIFKNNEIFGASDTAISSLGIDPGKRNVFIFSNIYWDAGLTETASLYDGVIPWVLDTIEILKDRPDCHLYVKPHPAEIYDATTSLRGIMEYIHERFPVLPKNVTIIPPPLKIKTYDLFPMIDVGVLFNGTLGLEMLQKGVPVVVAGLSPYGHLKSAASPQSREEYAKILTGESPAPVPDRAEVELFSYFYFIKALIPWTLTERAYGDDYKGYTFESLDELLPGKNPRLDHLCNCILDPDNTVVEGWS